MPEDDLLEELASLPTLACPAPSPDGGRVALYYDDTGRNQLHVLDVESGEWAQWSDGNVPRSVTGSFPLKWSAGGERVYFHADEDGDEQNDVHAIGPDGAAERVVDLDGQTVLNDVGPAGDALLVSSTASGQMNLHVHGLASGETEQITDYEHWTGSGLFAPDGDRIAYASNETESVENQDVYVADADGSNPRNLRVGETGAEAAPVDWGPDGDVLLVVDDTADRGRCGVYDLRTDEATWLGGNEYNEAPVAFTPDGDRVLAVRTRGTSKACVVYDLESGEGRELDLPAGVATFPGSRVPGRYDAPTLGDDRVLVVQTTPTTRPELLAYDLESDASETLVEAEYGDVDPGRFVDADRFSVASDGTADAPAEAVELSPSTELDVECLLYDSGKRPSPLVVNPHGGPPVHESSSFDLYAQFLATRGYSVLQMNYRGSAGFGREFREELYGDWGGAEQADVAAVAEHVLATRDWVDEDRVAVLGGSYGGYSAYWQLVQYPELYDAGVAWMGVTDLHDMFENTMPHYRTGLMERYLGTPEENPDLYEKRSPVTHAENLSAPLLMLHGVNDPRVPVSQARIFRDALDDAGFAEGEDGDYEYVELGEEGHGSSDIDQKMRSFRILDDFLDRRLGRPAVRAD